MTYLPSKRDNHPEFLMCGGQDRYEFVSTSVRNTYDPYGSGSYSQGFGYQQMFVQSSTSDTSGGYQICRSLVSPIDLSYYDTLTIRWKGIKGGSRTGDAGFSRFGISTTSYVEYNTNQFLSGYYLSYAYSTGWGEQEQSIDISSLKGVYYIRTEAMQSENDSGESNITIQTINIFLE